MRFLANENFPMPSVRALRDAGWSVESILESAQGAKDTAVIDRARRDGTIILTLDKDYGEIIFKQGIADPPAVIFLRYRGRDPLAPARLVLDVLTAGTTIEHAFTVIEIDGIRQRKYH